MCFRRNHTAPEDSRQYLVVGLGNIGAEYASTRHNLGFMVLDAWVQASDTFFVPGRYGDRAEMPFKGRKLHLLKPSTYMNLSGNAVRYWMQKLKIPASNLVVICDDLNLPYGTIRMRKSGSDGGHNGLKSIEEMIGTQAYCRIRIGIGHDFAPGEQVDYVIGEMSQQERELVPGIAERVIAGVKDFCTIGPERAMNTLNSRLEEAKK